MFSTLISAAELHTVLARQPVVLLDCRFQLADTEYGSRAYASGHLPGAHYLHLDRHLSGTKTGHNGRHPLPERAALTTLFGSLGIARDTQVVAYDDAGGMYAARAWWLLRWLGHEAVAVLDGGVAAWQASGGGLELAVPTAVQVEFSLGQPLAAMVDAAAVAANLAEPVFTVVDARAADRFRGENETLDPVGGHIPGARNRFFMLNLDNGRFKPADQLRSEWLVALDGIDAGQVVHQCGSGVTACVNLLAMEYGGLHGSRLYPGSWSEWCADPAHPIATGD